ncbi:MAG: hypothetical protein HZB46_09895 [Solirubrobacterales bacterium]|nr:hypothetical protein [Solirubrobacterales bacterium]
MTGAVLHRRLVVVTGKGGAGKSTVAAALGLAAVRRGRRTLVVEVAARDDVRRLVTGAAAGDPYVERALAPGLDHVSVDPGHALREYLRLQLPRPAAALLLAGRVFPLLAAATPGLAELLTIGKVWALAAPAPHRRHDLVVLDAPATGHALGLLHAPAAFAAATRTGPVTARPAASTRSCTTRGRPRWWPSPPPTSSRSPRRWTCGGGCSRASASTWTSASSTACSPAGSRPPRSAGCARWRPSPAGAPRCSPRRVRATSATSSRTCARAWTACRSPRCRWSSRPRWTCPRWSGSRAVSTRRACVRRCPRRPRDGARARRAGRRARPSAGAGAGTAAPA